MAKADVDWKKLVKSIGTEFEDGLGEFLKASEAELKEYGEDLAKLTIRVIMEADSAKRAELLEEVGINAVLIVERLRVEAVKELNARIKATAMMIAKVAISTALSLI